MTEEAPKDPRTPPSGDPGQPGARAYNDLGQVRPADGRYLGDASGDVPAQDLEAIREKELEDGYARLLKQKQAEEERNQEALEEAGYRNPTTEGSEAARHINAALERGDDADSSGDDAKPTAKKTATAPKTKA